MWIRQTGYIKFPLLCQVAALDSQIAGAQTELVGQKQLATSRENSLLALQATLATLEKSSGERASDMARELADLVAQKAEAEERFHQLSVEQTKVLHLVETNRAEIEEGLAAKQRLEGTVQALTAELKASHQQMEEV